MPKTHRNKRAQPKRKTSLPVAPVSQEGMAEIDDPDAPNNRRIIEQTFSEIAAQRTEQNRQIKLIGSMQSSRTELPLLEGEEAVRYLESWLLKRGTRRPKGQTPAQIFRYHTSENRVFYYPACGWDWEPLYLEDLLRCDVFIYCDTGIAPADFEARIHFPHPNDREARNHLELMSATIVPQRLVDVIAQLADDLTEQAHLEEPAQPWGRLVTFRRHIGDKPRPIQLWYFGHIAGATAYANALNAAN